MYIPEFFIGFLAGVIVTGISIVITALRYGKKKDEEDSE